MAAVAAAAVLALAACGSSDAPTVERSSDSTADTTTGDTAAPEETDATGDTVAPEDTTSDLPGYDEGGVMLPEDGTPVVQLNVQGAFAVVQPYLPEGWTTIYADGTVLLPSRASAAAQPQVWPYEVGHVDPDDVGTLMMHADGYRLLEARDEVPGVPEDVADPPTTTLVLSTAFDSFTHVAVGLGLGAGPFDPYSEVLMKVVGEIAELVNEAAAPPDDGSTWPVFYDAVALDIVAVDVTEEDTGIGTNTVVEWGGGGDLSAWTSCTTVDDPATVSFLVGELAGPKFQQGDRYYRVASRVHPPGTSCE